LADAQPLPHGRSRAGDRHLNFYESRDNLLPDWCYDNAFSGWYFNRTNACDIESWHLDVIRYVNNVATIIGTADFNSYPYSYTSSTQPTWAHQLAIGVYKTTGDVAGLTVQGSASCTSACRIRSSSFPSQAAPINTYPSGEAYFDTTVTAGGRGSSATTWSFFFTKPNTTPSATATITAPTVRCDQALPGRATSVGCIFPGYIPTMVYSRSGAYPELARHIGDAQASGLPGAYPTGTPTTRLTDSTKQQANRNLACPSSLPRPAGKSCDEYPYASTYQGASTGGGTARTFPWCSIAGPSGTGPTGYSRCMINDTQNTNGGSELGTFYNDNRVLDADPFRTAIIS
jgi:hypothetical protein